MVKFGARLLDTREAEWAEGYVDYQALKKMLKSMVANGRCREYSSLAVYMQPISVAKESVVLVPHGASEMDFMRAIEAEIEKVNGYSERLHHELFVRITNAEKAHAEWRARGSPAESAVRLREQMRACSEAVQKFEDFINLNYMAFSKILKKHDKHSSCTMRDTFLLRIQHATFVSSHRMGNLIKQVSDMHEALSSAGNGASSSARARQFDPNQDGGATFIRSTKKYWVQTRDVLKVKMFLLRNLPVYTFDAGPAIGGPTDAGLVTSVYFDSPTRRLYDGRLKKHHGAIALRVRWYGAMEPTDDDVVFMERKVHREDWFGDGEASAKERFPLLASEVVPLLTGRLSPEELARRLDERGFEGSNAQQLAEEVVRAVQTHDLRPSLRTHYMRTAFQRRGDASVRCSLDTDLCMALEPCGVDEWRRSAPIKSRTQMCEFAHAILEVKLQLATGTETPEWVQQLLRLGCACEAPKFSKFVHGTAALNHEEPLDGRPRVTDLPYWWTPQFQPLWRDDIGVRALAWNERTALAANSADSGRGLRGEGRVEVWKTPPQWQALVQRAVRYIATCGKDDGRGDDALGAATRDT